MTPAELRAATDAANAKTNDAYVTSVVFAFDKDSAAASALGRGAVRYEPPSRESAQRLIDHFRPLGFTTQVSSRDSGWYVTVSW